MDPVIRELLTPGPAEIIRATQKDMGFIRMLNEQVGEILSSIFGQKSVLKWGYEISNGTSFMYHFCTNFLTGAQTLGEEYCGILQVNQSATQTPGKVRLGVMIFLASFGYSALEFCTRLVEQYLSKLKPVKKVGTRNGEEEGEEIRHPMGEMGTDVIRVFKHFLPFLGQLHLALFYAKGTFYHFTKRLLGIYYILVKKSFANQDESSRQTLKYLMVISIVNSFLTCVNDSVSFLRSRKTRLDESLCINSGIVKKPETRIDHSKRCTLCLDQRTKSSVTPCGHLFCWGCIIDWLRSKPECPICREQFPASRVVPLQNYN